MRLGITAKLLVPLTLLFSLLTFFTTRYVVNVYETKQIELSQAHALSTAGSVAMLFNNTLDEDILKRIVTTIALEDQVDQAIIITAENDAIIASSRYRFANHSLNNLPSQLVNAYERAKGAGVYNFTSIENGFYALGYPIKAVIENDNTFREFVLLVHFDNYGLENELLVFSQNSYAVAFFFWLTLVVCSFLLLRNVVISPLRIFKFAMKAQAKNGTANPVKLRSNDELGDIAEEFNRLRHIEIESLNVAKEATLAAEQLAEKKTQFLANMSHELRTPINGVMGLAQLCMDTDSVDRQKVLLDQLLSSSKLLLSIVNDILDFSKIEEGRVTLHNADIDIAERINKITALMTVLADNKGLALSYKLYGDIPNTIRIDPQRLNQVLLNLLSNAIKFTHSGEVSVSVKFTSKTVNTGDLLIAVKDTGIGIDKKYLDTLFQPFEQGDSSVSRKFGGTGLGLSISKRLVELMGGDISVNSTLNQGSVFAITIPCEFNENAIVESSENQILPETLAGEILLVEDNEVNALVASSMLEAMGLSVSLAINGQKAIERVNHHTFDLILMDIQMPVLDGYKATAELRKMGVNTPIIGLSANVLEEEEQKAIAMGMNDYLHKPIEKHALFEKVAHYLAG